MNVNQMHIKVSDDGPTLEILSRTEQETAALKKLKQTYLSIEENLMHFLVMSSSENYWTRNK